LGDVNILTYVINMLLLTSFIHQTNVKILTHYEEKVNEKNRICKENFSGISNSVT